MTTDRQLTALDAAASDHVESGLGAARRPTRWRAPLLLWIAGAVAAALGLFVLWGPRGASLYGSSASSDGATGTTPPIALRPDAAGLAAAPKRGDRSRSGAEDAAARGEAGGAFAPPTAVGSQPGPRGATVIGVVVGPDGKPVEGVDVDLDSVRPLAIYQRASGAGRWDHLRVRTDAEGRFRFESVRPAEDYRLRARSAQGTAELELAASELTPGSSFDKGTLRLDGTVTLSGRVTDPDGHPLADVRVVVGPRLPSPLPVLLDDPALFPDAEDTTTTGEDGRFRFEHLSSGPKAVVARAPSGAAAGVFTGPGSENDITLVLGGGAFVAGRVVDAAGAPIAGARVLAKRLDEPLAHESPTGADGAFRIERLRPGAYLVAAIAGDLAPRFVPVVAPNDKVRLELPRGGHLVGHVVFAESGKPIPAFALELEPVGTEGEQDDPMLWRMQMLARDRGPRQIRSEDGRFDLGPMLAARYILRVHVDGRPDAGPEESPHVAADAVTDVGTIEVGEARRIAGTVVDAEGKALVDATVFVLPAEQVSWTPNEINHLGSPLGDTIHSDEAGHFESGPIVSGRYVVAVRPRLKGDGPSALSAPFLVGASDVRDVRVTLPAAGGVVRVEGFSRGQPIGDAPFVLLHEAGERVFRKTDPPGTDEISGLRVGRWLVAYCGRDTVKAVGEMDAWWDERPAPEAAWSALQALKGTVGFTLAPRADVAVRVECPPLVRWSGTIRVEGLESPIARMLVRSAGDPKDEAACDVTKDGGFLIGAIAPGAYDVYGIEPANEHWAYVRVTIPDAPTFESALVLRK